MLLPTFAATGSAGLSQSSQFALIALGGFLMTCTVGPVSAIVIDVIHPGVRATGASVLALFQNLFGLAAGPFIAGVLSDASGWRRALTAMPAFGVAGGRGLPARRRAATKPTCSASPRCRSLPSTGTAAHGRAQGRLSLARRFTSNGTDHERTDDAAAAADLARC